MRIIIYKGNNIKNVSFVKKISEYLDKKNIQYEIISESKLKEKIEGNVIISFGGDGTVLKLTEFSIKNKLPILAINTGNMGFLTEFEKEETIDAIELFINGKYKKDFRSVLSVEYNNKSYFALNDAVIQRQYYDNYTNLVVKISTFIDGNFVDDIKGDGVIVSTPTGSTAYSLSSGGSILAPNINANSLTPICAHSLHNRPIVFSSDSDCTLKIIEGNNSALFIDGKYISSIKENDCVYIKKINKKIEFIRKEDSNFYKILLTKFSKGK